MLVAVSTPDLYPEVQGSIPGEGVKQLITECVSPSPVGPISVRQGLSSVADRHFTGAVA